MESIRINTIGKDTISVGDEIYILSLKDKTNIIPISKYNVDAIIPASIPTSKIIHMRLRPQDNINKICSFTAYLDGKNVNLSYSVYNRNSIYLFTNISQAYLFWKDRLQDNMKKVGPSLRDFLIDDLYKLQKLIDEDKIIHPEFYY